MSQNACLKQTISYLEEYTFPVQVSQNYHRLSSEDELKIQNCKKKKSHKKQATIDSQCHFFYLE